MPNAKTRNAQRDADSQQTPPGRREAPNMEPKDKEKPRKNSLGRDNREVR